MGLDYFMLQQYNEAERAFAESSRLFQEVGDESWRLNAMDGLAMTYLAQHKYTQSMAILREALQVLSDAEILTNHDYLYQSLHKHWHETVEKLKGNGADL